MLSQIMENHIGYYAVYVARITINGQVVHCTFPGEMEKSLTVRNRSSAVMLVIVTLNW